MTTFFDAWAARYPQAAADLIQVLAPAVTPARGSERQPEAAVQQQVRFKIAQAGHLSWRNNVGATPARCPDCGAPRQPIRYGLANDSAKLNEQIKSSDLILAIPRRVTQGMVGQTIAQFGSVETKHAGWVYTGKGQEAGQAAWLALINRIGGYGVFSTGEYET